MQIKTMFTESRAVSPVIGVILMVAITVILAAVIGTFVLGLGDQVGDTAPQASFTFDYDGTELTITHESGAQIDGDLVTIAGDINVTVDGEANKWSALGSDTISAGESVVVQDTDEDGFANGDTVRVVWTSESGSNSATLQTYTH
ncbi:type IV pilin [Haloferax sp. AS1]|uniref:type IV pilin n=1 Tax=Haloferax sp. AS1 TaxID=2562277 RepID=UPI00165F3E87|nr:type IV pilin N-terminal domain-containing protein [Haloferax sp. AS1]MBC9987616.1 type IV pilin [Haloferax sp. AS1]